jgi:predicted nucleotidyltransferase
MNDVNDIVQECSRILSGIYGKRFDGLLLYGSSVRGEDTEESDIDLLVLLKGDLDIWKEIGRVVDVLYPLQLRTNRLISAKPVRSDAYRSGAVEFYRSVMKEAIAV